MAIAIIFALGAAIVFIVYSLIQGKSVLGGSKNEAMAEEIGTVSANMSSHYTTEGSFAGATTATEIANGDIPSGNVDTATGTVNTPYGGTLAVLGTASVNGGSNNAVGLGVNNLTQQECIKLAGTVSDYGTNSGTTVGAGVNSQNSVATDAQAATICTNANGNSLAFTYTLGN
ncbi:MAG: hypothetical protein HKL99_10660 [Burkholderiales bacterium]|nr:hypothetical protein [Burkholderiales bacterium]